MSTTIRILGIDPGLRITGFAVIDEVGQKLVYVASGCVKSSDKDSRLAELKRLRYLLQRGGGFNGRFTSVSRR